VRAIADLLGGVPGEDLTVLQRAAEIIAGRLAGGAGA
jgi:hypothetical protein